MTFLIIYKNMHIKNFIEKLESIGLQMGITKGDYYIESYPSQKINIFKIKSFEFDYVFENFELKGLRKK